MRKGCSNCICSYMYLASRVINKVSRKMSVKASGSSFFTLIIFVSK